MFDKRNKAIESTLQEQFSFLREAFEQHPPLYLNELNVSLDVALKQYSAVYVDEFKVLFNENFSNGQCTQSKLRIELIFNICEVGIL